MPAPTEAPFDSAHQALLFAMTFASRDHGRAAAAERRLATFSHERYADDDPPPAPTARGLGGLDGAAQAGMVLSRLARLTPFAQAILTAKFTRRNPPAKHLACEYIALRARHELHLEFDLTLILVKRFHGSSVNILAIADHYDVHPSTAFRWAARVKRWIAASQVRAVDDAETELKRAGIVRDY